MEIGYFKDEICNRDGCNGILNEHDTDKRCLCHINPPCSYCEESRVYCPVCGYEGEEEQYLYQEANKPTEKQIEYWRIETEKREENKRKFWELFHSKDEVTELHYLNENHTNSSMKLTGMYPKNMTIEELLKEIRGSFGGRFEYLDNTNCRFRYIAYTD